MRDTIAQRLREVRVRPTVGARERQRWDELMAAHHYPSALDDLMERLKPHIETIRAGGDTDIVWDGDNNGLSGQIFSTSKSIR